MQPPANYKSPKNICFVISPIGEEGTEVRRRADQVLKHVIEPSLAECGFEAVRADKMPEPGMITSQVIQHIVDAPLVIADLTGSNPNVFYELAIRHAIRKPLVQLIQKGEKIPFDVAGMRTIPIDHKDLDSVDDARNQIIKQVRSFDNKSQEDIDSPITVSIELQRLRQSDNPEQRSLAEFVSVVGELRSDIAEIEKRLSDPRKLFPWEILAEFGGRSYVRTKDIDMLYYGMRGILDELTERMPGDNRIHSLSKRLEEITLKG